MTRNFIESAAVATIITTILVFCSCSPTDNRGDMGGQCDSCHQSNPYEQLFYDQTRSLTWIGEFRDKNSTSYRYELRDVSNGLFIRHGIKRVGTFGSVEYRFYSDSVVKIHTSISSDNYLDTICYPYVVAGSDTIPADNVTCTTFPFFKWRGAMFGVDTFSGTWRCTQDSISMHYSAQRSSHASSSDSIDFAESFQYYTSLDTDSLYFVDSNKVVSQYIKVLLPAHP
jgi:hypothetical protein